MRRNDMLKIGFDTGFSGDKAVLVVARRKGRGIEVVNTFADQEAEELYLRLSGEDKHRIKKGHEDKENSPDNQLNENKEK